MTQTPFSVTVPLARGSSLGNSRATSRMPRAIACRFCQSGDQRSNGRSPAKEMLPIGEGLLQNPCYQRHRKGGPVTERGRGEYVAVMRQRYQQAKRRERGALLDEYCRVTCCHRKATIRRLGAASPGRHARHGSEQGEASGHAQDEDG